MPDGILNQEDIDKMMGITSAPPAAEAAPQSLSSAPPASGGGQSMSGGGPASMGGNGAPTGGGAGNGVGALTQGPPNKTVDMNIQNLDFILDIPLRVSVELGRAKIVIRDLLQLSQGSVVELAKFAGEPLEILVNDKLVARGDVVVVNEKFGVRLTDIISPAERIEQLK